MKVNILRDNIDMNIHERYMRLALALARRGEGMTSPNPAVGACVVKRGRVTGRGYHQRAGGPHAEVRALEDAGSSSRGATLYVTLEPCDHFGRTPPCTKAIIESGIRTVVVGVRDPNPLVNGKGIRTLKRHGIRVLVGVLKGEAESLNRPYNKFVSTGMPYVTVKLAESLDGKIATKKGDSKWVSSASSRKLVHRLRSRVDAVMVGANTVLRDDPLLTARPCGRVRHRTRPGPLTVIVDSALRTPLSARLFSRSGYPSLLFATTLRASKAKVDAVRKAGAEVLCMGSKKGRVDLRGLLSELARRKIVHVLVEGGGELAASLFEGGLADRILFFIAPKIVGGRRAVTSAEGEGSETMDGATRVRNMHFRKSGEDILVEGEVGACSPAS